MFNSVTILAFHSNGRDVSYHQWRFVSSMLFDAYLFPCQGDTYTPNTGEKEGSNCSCANNEGAISKQLCPEHYWMACLQAKTRPWTRSNCTLVVAEIKADFFPDLTITPLFWVITDRERSQEGLIYHITLGTRESWSEIFEITNKRLFDFVLLFYIPKMVMTASVGHHGKGLSYIGASFLVLLLNFSLTLCSHGHSRERQPNIVFILADDLGRF